MGQSNVFEFLEQNKGKWFNSSEIAKKINISRGSVLISLRKLRDRRQIYWAENQERKNSFRYMVK